MESGIRTRNPLSAIRGLRQSSFVRNAGWLMAGQGTGLLFQAVYFVFLARLLGTTGYGIFAGAFAFTSLIAQYSPLGTGTVFLRYVSGHPEKFSSYFGNILLATAAMSGLLILGLTLSAKYLLNPASAHLVLLAAIANCFFAQLTTEIGRVFQAFEKMRITATLNLLVSALRTLAVLGLLLAMHHASAFQWAIASTTVSGIAAAAAVILAIVNFGRPRLDLAVARKHALEGIGFSFAGSTTSIYNDLDKTMLSHYGMNEDNGIYSMAYRLIDFATMPIFAIRDAALPRLFQLGHTGIDKSAEYGRKLMRRSLLMGALGSAALFFMAPLIPKIVGQGFADSVTAVRWLAVIPIFRAIHQMSGIVLTSAGRQGLRTIAQVTAAALNFGLNLWLIPRFGWHGAAWASVATDGALAVMNWTLLKIVASCTAPVNRG